MPEGAQRGVAPRPGRGEPLGREAVALAACGSYRRDEVAGAVRWALDLLGGMGRFVPRGSQVLLKANLLRPSPRERRVLTDGEVIRAAAQLAIEAGGEARLGDSPGLGSAERVARSAGIAAALKGVACPVVEFADQRPAGSGLFPALELAGDVLDADVVIDLPKLKTHVQMELTGAVKNLFGAVVGKRKPQWHLRCGSARESFARMLVECCRISGPALTIADGVVAMEGEGPNSGSPRTLGVIIAGTHPVAVDLAFMEIIGFPSRESPVHRAARELGYGPASLDEVDLRGDPVDRFRVADFRRADIGFAMFPGAIGRAMRRLFVSWPEVVARKCVACGQCAEACAAGAVTVAAPEAGPADERAARIDYSKCIRCFCCHEICPERAIALRHPLMARLLGWRPRGREEE